MNRLTARSFVIGGILAGLCSQTWAASLPLGQVVTGAIGSVAQFNSYTFIGAANDVVDFTLVTTSGGLVPRIQLYNPSGTLIASNYAGSPYGCGGSTLELNTVQLPVAGTYTVDVSDCSSTNSGSYSVYAQRTNNPAGAANLPFAQTTSGTVVSATQSNSYTFSANANDEIDFTMVTTSGTFVPKIRLYNPIGTLLSSNYSGSPYGCGGSTLELNTVSLPTTGTYTVLIGDCSDTLTGTYEIYTQRTDNPTGPIGLLFGQTQTGTLSSTAGSNTYTFSANATDAVDFTVVTTSGSLVPKIRVNTPTGSLLSSNYSGSPYGCGGSTLELNTVSLPTTGTYTALIGDCSDTLTGTYTIYSQRTNNPAGAANLPIGQTQTGLLGSTAASNTYTFSANASDVLDFTMVTTSGSLVPKIRLYNPIGTLLSSNSSGSPYGCGGSTLELNTVTLPTTGSYTLLVGDCSDTLTGNYAIYAQRTNNPAGPIGLVFSQVQTGMIGSTAQSDTYTFPGSSGNVVDFTVVTTSGSLVPKIRLYNPNGTLLSSNYSGSPYGCSGTTVPLNSITLTQSGTHTVLVGDCTDTLTGTYHISSQCFGACPLPAPVVTSVSPASVAAGGSAFTLTVNGSNFVSGSVVSWNGNSRVTTYVSATQLTAVILASDIASIGSFPVTVLNPAALAGPSNAVNVTVTTTSNPAPTLTSISPTSASAGGGAFTLTANGSNFLANSVVNWNGTALVTTFLSATQLQAQVPAADIATAASPLVTVFNPAPGGGTSGAQTFTVVGGSSPPAAPVLISPPTGSPGVTVPPTLAWTAAAGAGSYDVYLGTASQPPFVTNVTGTSYSPPALLGGNRYYWNIVARNGSRPHKLRHVVIHDAGAHHVSQPEQPELRQRRRRHYGPAIRHRQFRRQRRGTLDGIVESGERAGFAHLRYRARHIAGHRFGGGERDHYGQRAGRSQLPAVDCREYRERYSGLAVRQLRYADERSHGHFGIDRRHRLGARFDRGHRRGYLAGASGGGTSLTIAHPDRQRDVCGGSAPRRAGALSEHSFQLSSRLGISAADQ